MSRAPRIFLLEGTTPDGVRRFLSRLPDTLALSGDAPEVWMTVTRMGRFTDPRYGEFEITRDMLLSMVANFEKGTYGQKIYLDVSHRPSDGAAGEFLKLTVDGTRLRGLIRLTPFGVEAIKERGFAYLSAEFAEDFRDNEKGESHGALLLGAGLTIRPVIKHLDPVQLAAPDGPPTLMHPELATQLSQEIHTMWAELLRQLTERLRAMKLAETVINSLVAAATKALAAVTDEKIAKTLCDSFEESGKQLVAQIGDKAVTLSINVPEIKTGMSAEDVKKLMEERDKKLAEDAKRAQDARAAKVKLLTDTIDAVKDFDDATKKQLADEVRDLVTADLTDEQVKKLAETQVKHGHEVIAARKLAGLGFERTGTPFITVDSSNEVKALQEHMDQRIKLAPDAERFAVHGGQLPKANKDFADRVLAEFDRTHGARLHLEHQAVLTRKLAGGDGLVADVAVPAIFERTVIREALYALNSLSFMDTGTYPFSAVAQIPYSYRDTTAAGVDQVRVYEGGAVRRAGVKQAMHEARPIPQKIAFEVSDELRYLTQNGQLDWDVVAENVRNAARIIGEDTERLNYDEQLRAADEYSTVNVVNEAVATADGTKKIFVLDQFPVVRPRKFFNLAGGQEGSTLYPITVKVNSVDVAEYDGTGTQGAGLYYVMDYNLGELRFVNQLGVLTAPTNSHAIVCSYTYTTNVKKFDTKLGTLKVDEKWDNFLYEYGLRKAVISSQRYYTPNFGLMSDTVRTTIEQARQFGANYQRAGTDLSADGNLGRVKNVPNFIALAPGLAIGDQRVVIGQRGVSRFRMMKPWSMGQLENQKDGSGRFTGKKEAYGDQFIVVTTPTPLRGALTSMVLYDSDARVDR